RGPGGRRRAERRGPRGAAPRAGAGPAVGQAAGARLGAPVMEGEPQPRASRPHIPDYGIPDTPEGLLPWSWARERLEQALTYWIATVRPEGRPHMMPSWGAWVGDRFFFEGGPRTRRGRDIAPNPGGGGVVGGRGHAGGV